MSHLADHVHSKLDTFGVFYPIGEKVTTSGKFWSRFPSLYITIAMKSPVALHGVAVIPLKSVLRRLQL